MSKSAEAFRTISEVADWLGLPSHVLRFWESKFTQVKPVKRAGGRRYYRPNDMLLLGGIKKLLHDDGMTIKGAQKVLRESGVKEVSALSQPLDMDDAALEAIDMVEITATQETADAPFMDAEPQDRPSEVISFAHHTAETADNVPEAAPAASAPAPTPEAEPLIAAPVEAAPTEAAPTEPEPTEAAPTETAPTESAPAEPEPTEPVPLAASTEEADSPAEPEARAEAQPPEEVSEAPLRTSASGLPSFLKPAEDTNAPQAEAPAPLTTAQPLPADPGDTDLDVSAGLLSRLAAFKEDPDPETRRRLEQARHDLKALVS